MNDFNMLPHSDNWNSGDHYEYYMGRWSKSMAPAFLNWLNMPDHLTWLDVGCGTGALSEAIRQNCNPLHLASVDPSDEFLNKAKQKFSWREAPFYTDKERAALAWAEALTKINSNLIPDEIYAGAKKHFPETELVDLTMAIIAINGYNRINIAFGSNVGTYQVSSKN